MPGQRVVDLPAICEYLGMSEQAVRALVRDQRIPVIRVDRRLRFDLRRIDEWLKANTVEAAS